MGKNIPNKIGKRYGQLEVKEYLGKGVYRCKCDCGNFRDVLTNSLRNDRKGVFRCEECQEKYLKSLRRDKKVGQKFGMLEVKEYLGNGKYKCLCDCGNYTVVDTKELSHGKHRGTKSCGCLTPHFEKDENFFETIDTEEKAYIAGFIAADGWVEKDRNRINIELSAVDKEILEKIKKELEIENPIIERETGNGFSVVRLNWSSGPQKEALSKFGIVNRKTYKEMHLPLFEDKNLTYAFILGFFDGDGTISIDKDYCRFRLCAHRSELLEDIKNFLNVPSSLNQDNRGLWEFSISTIYSIPLFKKLYSLDSIYLERKHNKFLEYNKSKRV